MLPKKLEKRKQLYIFFVDKKILFTKNKTLQKKLEKKKPLL